MKTECVECGSPLSVPKDVMYGEVLDCAECGVELVVQDVEKMELKAVETTDEDWGQ